MSKIVISGYYGFANAGDEAMLTAIIKSLRSQESNIHLTVISGNPLYTAKKYHVTSIHRFNLLKIISALKSSDLLLSGGGSLLQDVTSKRSLFYYLSVLILGKLLQKKVMLFAQGIGPISNSLLKKLTKLVCKNVDLITVRDSDSLAELEKLGIIRGQAKLTADAVLTLPKVSKAYGAEILKEYSVPQNKKIIAVSVRSWFNNVDYLHQLAKAADYFVDNSNAHIVLLPLQYNVDKKVCYMVQEYMQNKSESTVLDVNCDTEQFLSLIGNTDLLIGMRLHSLVFAAVMEVPFVAVSYDPKIDGFVKEIKGCCAGSVASVTDKSIISAAERALLEKEKLVKNLQTLRQKALCNIKSAFSLLQDK